MSPTCHRCGAPFSEASSYCSQCGAPQLRVPENDAQQGNGTIASVAASANRLGPATVNWRDAFLSAFTAAIGMGILCSGLVPFLSSFFFFWALAGAMVAVSRYHRRAPNVYIDAMLGARIGAASGLFAGTIALSLTVTALLVTRFSHSHGSNIDGFLTDLLRQSAQSAMQKNPELQNTGPIWSSPTWHAGMAIFAALFGFSAILAFSTIGGLIGGKILSGRRKLL